MDACIRIRSLHSYKPKLDTRSDQVCRWSSYGARSYKGLQGESTHAPIGSHNDKCPLIWFGGNGLKAGFTVPNVAAIFPRKSYHRRKVTGHTLSFYQRKLQGITIAGACQVLAAIGCTDDTFYRTRPFAEGKYNRAYCTPAKVANLKGWYNGGGWFKADDDAAEDMGAIQFVGGPPSRWGIHSGSLFTLLMDRVAVLVLLQGAAADIYNRLENYMKN